MPFFNTQTGGGGGGAGGGGGGGGGVFGNQTPAVDPLATTVDPYFPDVLPQIPQPRVADTGDPIDPLTGRPIPTGGLREGAGAGQAAISRGLALDALSEQRRAEALAGLRGLLDGPLQSGIENAALNNLNGDPSNLDELGRLLFARGADAAATSSTAVARQAASQFGGRGISGSSPLAAGLAQQIDLQRTGQVRGVERDVRVELLRRSAADRATALTQALQAQQSRAGIVGGIADITQRVPTFGNDALQGLTELIIEREGLARAESAGKKKAKNDKFTSLITGAASIAGAAGV